MEAFIWIGSLVSLAGVALLVGCIVSVARLRRSELSDEVMRARLWKVVAWNFGALAISGVGLMLVVLGILLA